MLLLNISSKTATAISGLATSGGVTKYDGRYFTNYSKKNGLIDDNVFYQMEDAKGNLWFGTERGLSKFDGKVFTNYDNRE